MSQWVSKARQGGVPALRHRKPPGGPSKLSAEQRGQLPGLLDRGPWAYGFSGEVWTRRRVAQVIEQEFGVSYDPSQVGRILKGGGFSRQKPALRATQRDEDAICVALSAALAKSATQRDEDAIRDWRERRFPALKKGPSRRQNHLVGRRIGVLPAARFAAHPASSAGQALGAGGPDPGNPTQVELRPSERD